MKTQLFSLSLLAVANAVYTRQPRTGMGPEDYIVSPWVQGNDRTFYPSHTEDGQFKYVFAWPKDDRDPVCTATMISPRVAITAAHCTTQFRGFLAGSRDGNRHDGPHWVYGEGLKVDVDSQEYTIEDFIVPKCWSEENEESYGYDIALLVLDRPVGPSDGQAPKIGEHFVGLYDPRHFGELEEGDEFVVNGYGWYQNWPDGWKQRRRVGDKKQGNSAFRRGWNKINESGLDLYHFTFDGPDEALEHEAGLAKGDDGSGMLIERYENDEFVEHLIAGVAHDYDLDTACTEWDDQSGDCAGWTFKIGYRQSYARTDGRALDWINNHIDYFNQVSDKTREELDTCECLPWYSLQQIEPQRFESC